VVEAGAIGRKFGTEPALESERLGVKLLDRRQIARAVANVHMIETVELHASSLRSF